MNDNPYQAFDHITVAYDNTPRHGETTGTPMDFGEWWLSRRDHTADLWASPRLLIVHVGTRFTIISRTTCEPVMCYSENTPLGRVMAALRGLDTRINTPGIVHQLTGRD